MSVLVSAPPGRRGLPQVDRGRLRARARRVLDELCHAASELSVSLVDDAAIAELNARFRQRRGATDVLSFSWWRARTRSVAVPCWATWSSVWRRRPVRRVAEGGAWTTKPRACWCTESCT